MFSIFKSQEEYQLDAIIQRIESNMSNNYKDAAQEALKDFEEKLSLARLTEKKRALYESYLDTYKIRMKGFTHKDQKPYWT